MPLGVQKLPGLRSNSQISPQSEQLVDAIVAEKVHGGQSAITNAKSALKSAAATVTMRTINDRPVIANDRGATFLEELSVRVNDLEKNLKQTRKLATYYYDVRKRCYLTYLRDHVDGQKNIYQTEIKDLNEGVVHGGQCVADSEVIPHQPDGPYYFQRIYGVAPEVVDNLSLDKHHSVIEVLNIVGGLRFRGFDLEHKHSLVFQDIVNLLDKGQYDAAQTESRFPRPPLPPIAAQ
ncbi:hypothetical protein PVAR5_0265 [Paecilomyces variotii No. 5]|uniref:Uncharacterized protein n=1 Tax=Byssochlamys spectabilis (strain No. 5 / NBRC 109023) TaxID=1356009 RepID=V5FQ11_BYSSN|nr:hypothetical protein PVAR5_0265 [Paecilomyces variotii No. 5]